MIDPVAIKEKCQGMLPPSVYRRIYQTALQNDAPVFLEIGTFFAATTVCLARAVKDAGKSTRVYTVEKVAERIKHNIGGTDENLSRIRENLAYFEVDDVVEVLMGSSEQCAPQIPGGAPIGLMFVDADGRLDRDMRLFYDRLGPDADIMFDDINDDILIWRRQDREGNGLYRIDAKHKISFDLLNAFKAAGLLSEGSIMGNTYFGKKLDRRFADLSHEAVLDCYHKLVLANGRMKRPSLKKQIKSVMPAGIMSHLKKLKNSAAG